MTSDTKWAHLPARPWKYTGHTVEKYQACQGAPIQPGTCCDHCYTGIMQTFHFLAVKTGERFKVGSTCVEKMLKEMRTKSLSAAERKIRELRNAAARERRQRKLVETRAAAQAILDADADRLAAIPHPVAWRADKGETLTDWAKWMLSNGGLPAAKVVLETLTRTGGSKMTDKETKESIEHSP